MRCFIILVNVDLRAPWGLLNSTSFSKEKAKSLCPFNIPHNEFIIMFLKALIIRPVNWILTTKNSLFHRPHRNTSLTSYSLIWNCLVLRKQTCNSQVMQDLKKYFLMHWCLKSLVWLIHKSKWNNFFLCHETSYFWPVSSTYWTVHVLYDAGRVEDVLLWSG